MVEPHGSGESRPPETLGSLAALVGGTVTPLDAGDVVIHDVVDDSRDAFGTDTLFAAVPGERSDGHDFIADVAGRGAVAALVDRHLDAVSLPQLVVDDVRRRMGPVAHAVHGRPADDLTVVGVTGTNGKTTYVTLLAQLLEAMGVNAVAFGTLTGVRTTPESPEIARRLARARADGTEVVAMEVSSHALALDRVAGFRFDLATFTNLGRDHLDFHRTQEDYFAAKARLFDTSQSKRGLVNVDDVHGRLLLDAAGDAALVGYSIGDADHIEISSSGAAFHWRGRAVRTGLLGRVNVLNTIAVMESAVLLGHDPDAIAAAVSTVSGVPGRFQAVDLGGAAPAVIVDYAHTPDALAAVLESASELADGPLTVVFGCGGDRDTAKRPEMGRVASEHADRVILTSDNPRSEDPLAIIEAIAQGSRRVDSVVPQVWPDRRRAIRAAVEGAGGGVVVIAGKGHETTQTFADHVEPFDDAVVVAEEWASLGRPRRDVP